MRLGVTGTKNGGTSEQLGTFKRAVTYAHVLHHGSCIGFDAQAAVIAKRIGIRVVSHPPLNTRFKAHTPDDEVREPKDYGERDQDIVNECEVLIGVPQFEYETLRSGTWMTIRYAVKQNRTTYVIWPNGELQHYWGESCLAISSL